MFCCFMMTMKIKLTEVFQMRVWLEFWPELTKICSSFSRVVSNISDYSRITVKTARLRYAYHAAGRSGIF